MHFGMSDLSIAGRNPKTSEGKEYFLHCGDWWLDIIAVIENLPDEKFSIEEHFVREIWLAPPMPRIDEDVAQELAVYLEDVLASGEAKSVFLNNYLEGLDVEKDEETIQGWVEHSLELLVDFTVFLKACGGCEARWSKPGSSD